MAVELKFSRPSPDVSWGFRIVGGVDFNEPLVVVKVLENSLAEQGGLEIGDILVRINDTPTAALTHTEAHDLLIATGNYLELAVRRGEMPTHIFHYETSAEEELNRGKPDIVKEVEESLQQTILNVAVDRINKINDKNSAEDLKKINALLSENLSGKEEIIFTTSHDSEKSITHGIKKDKKWSTFLVKPNNPIPKPKQDLKEDSIKGEEYKVVIKKQPSKRKRAEMQERKVHFDEIIVKSKDEEIDVEENEEYTKIEYKRNFDVDMDVTVTEEDNLEDTDDSFNSENDADDEKDVETDDKRDSIELNYLPLSEIKVSNESSVSLEDQLREVQRQLEALSHLPSAIQMTLDAVSKQLASIVSERESSQDKEEQKSESQSREDDIEKNDEEEEYKSDSDVAEAEQNGHEIADTNSNVDDDFDEDDIADSELQEILQRNATSDTEMEPEYQKTEEEESAQLIASESMEKKKKVEQWNSTWPWCDEVKPVHRNWLIVNRIKDKND